MAALVAAGGRLSHARTHSFTHRRADGQLLLQLAVNFFGELVLSEWLSREVFAQIGHVPCTQTQTQTQKEDQKAHVPSDGSIVFSCCDESRTPIYIAAEYEF